MVDVYGDHSYTSSSGYYVAAINIAHDMVNAQKHFILC